MLLVQCLELVSGLSLELPLRSPLSAFAPRLTQLDEEDKEHAEAIVACHKDNHHPPIGLELLGVLEGEVSEKQEGVKTKEEESITETEELVHSLSERPTEEEKPHLDQSQQEVENELSERPLVKKQKDDNDAETTEEKPGEVVESEEATPHSQRTVHLAIVSERGGALVSKQVRRVGGRILELDYQENHSSESQRGYCKLNRAHSYRRVRDVLR